MKGVKRFILAVLQGVFVAFTFNAAAETNSKLPIFLNESEEKAVLEGETVTRSSAAGEDVASLVPSNTYLYKELSLVPPYDESGKEEKTFAVASASYVKTDKDILSLYNALTAISTQKGITYLSRREGYKPKVLFSESYCIGGEYKKGEDLVAMPDPIADKIKENMTIFAFQEDSSFSGNVYRYDITGGDVIAMHITNETAMKYHGVTCLKEKELSMFVEITPCEGGAVVNTAAVITGHKATVRILLFTVDLSSSFSRRTRALHDWYRMQVNEK